MLELGIIYRDGLVLQQGKKMRINGTFIPNIAKQVTIKAALKSGTKTVSEGSVSVELVNGEESAPFTVSLSEMSKGGPFTLEIYELNHPSTLITIDDVYVGEVWLAGGHENRTLPLCHTLNAKEEVSDFKDRKIRYYKVPVADENTPAEDRTSEWTRIGKKNVGSMSAIAYYFIKSLRSKLTANTMIGIVECAADDTSVMSWMSENNIRNTVDGKLAYKEYMSELYDKDSKEYTDIVRQIGEEVRQNWDKLNEMIKENPYITYSDMLEGIGHGKLELPKLKDDVGRPGILFNNMLMSIKSFCFRGVIFYQGESDYEERCERYYTLFKSMINEWREVFEDEKLPFIYAQLPMYISKTRRFMNFDDMHLPILRSAQTRVANEMPYTYMVTLTDCGEFDNMRPSDKMTPGTRMGLSALKHVYGNFDLSADAPHVVDIKRGSEGVEISFGGDFKELTCVYSDASESGFELAGNTDEFFPATASIDFDGKTVILDCPKVEFPTKVRYAYFSYGNAPLVTDKGLAVGPINELIEKKPEF
ncbi:MAG: sialate O-acetylesterase [Clostridia bacterium]|nr:sialate O-acetylesterase [Clostridia bacterium]